MNISSARRLALITLLGAGLLAAPQVATAAPPTDKLTVTTTGPRDDLHIVVNQGQACQDFALRVDGVNSQTQTLEYRNKKGELVRSFESGQGYELTYTNETTNASVTFAASYFSEDINFNKNGSIAVTNTGQFGIILFPSDIPAGPSATTYNGRVTYTVDKKGVFRLGDVAATATDICALLS